MTGARIISVQGGGYTAEVNDVRMYFEDYTDAAVWVDKQLYGEENGENELPKLRSTNTKIHEKM